MVESLPYVRRYEVKAQIARRAGCGDASEDEDGWAAIHVRTVVEDEKPWAIRLGENASWGKCKVKCEMQEQVSGVISSCLMNLPTVGTYQ
ncbi:hypothetical protein VFPPC_17389 [Pochonia chlamydosporia 170]|uniref:Uncharacterized protein n=1 Tax=Pochonia chlamydosporia 170 TaxID=1380566 RepID=A0A219AS39_METCM|nr:hypothetical protein VFPPC_17389 [Pochonia chlamydosporia 170]OWT43462.1 hypothetical protein VFPPC_17389 [Pochonia chlamydosporia 170]